MVGRGIGKIPSTRTIYGMTAAMKTKDHAYCTHNDCCLSRWTVRESFRYMYDRPWNKVSDFYLDLVRGGGGHSSLYRLVSSEKINSNVVLEYCHGDEELNLMRVSSGKRQGRWERITFKIVLSYHGSSFDGWQKQPDLNTVQGFVEKSLGRFVDEKKAQQLKEKLLPVEGCATVAGRTDKGVSALQQIPGGKMLNAVT